MGQLGQLGQRLEITTEFPRPNFIVHPPKLGQLGQLERYRRVASLDIGRILPVSLVARRAPIDPLAYSRFKGGAAVRQLGKDETPQPAILAGPVAYINGE